MHLYESDFGTVCLSHCSTSRSNVEGVSQMCLVDMQDKLSQKLWKFAFLLVWSKPWQHKCFDKASITAVVWSCQKKLKPTRKWKEKNDMIYCKSFLYFTSLYFGVLLFSLFVNKTLTYAFMIHIKINVHVLRYNCRLKIVIYLMYKK